MKSSLRYAAPIGALLSSIAAMAQTPPLAPAFYVAPGGKDNAAGTLAAPFATIDKCLTAMRASSTQKTCYFRAGDYPQTSTTQCYGNPFAVKLAAADNGVTLSYYPPDGYGSAHITGGGSVEGGLCLEGSGITVDGLDVGGFSRFAIASNNINNTIKNNTLHDTTIVQSNGTLFMNGDIRGNVASHNYVYNSSNNGIVAQPNAANNLDKVVIDSNVVDNSTTHCGDCGAIYVQDVLFSTRSTSAITNNLVRGLAANFGSPGSKGIYLDDGASGFTVTGNVVAPGAGGWAGFHIHGGQNNTISGNIVDQNGAIPGGIMFYQTSGLSNTGKVMAGNLFERNIVLTATGNPGGGYTLDGSPTNKLTVRDNDYWGYGSATPSHSGPAAVGGGDSNRANVDPGFICGWDYTLPANSPVFSAPTRFPAQPAGWGSAGFWGPPGFVVPRTGTPPSPPCSATPPVTPPTTATLSCSFTSPPITVTQGGAAVPVPPLSVICK